MHPEGGLNPAGTLCFCSLLMSHLSVLTDIVSGVDGRVREREYKEEKTRKHEAKSIVFEEESKMIPGCRQQKVNLQWPKALRVSLWRLLTPNRPVLMMHLGGSPHTAVPETCPLGALG